MNPAPLDLETVLSPAWLDAALAARFPGVRVRATAIAEKLTTIASKVRFTVDYAHDPGNAAPRALCAKGYFEKFLALEPKNPKAMEDLKKLKRGPHRAGGGMR